MKKVRLYGHFSDESEIVIKNILVNSYDNLSNILSVFDLSNSLLEISDYSRNGELYIYLNSNKLTYFENEKSRNYILL